MTNGNKNAVRTSFVGNQGTTAINVTSEAVTIAAGAAGTIKTCQLVYRPVLDLAGSDFGGVSNTSLALTSTAFTTEVQPKDDADLANGEFWVDYQLGLIRGKKADTSTSMTATYKSLAVSSTLVTKISGEGQTEDRLFVEEKNTFYARITTATTTAAKTGAGVLTRIIVEVALTGTATIYDNTAGSGSVLAILPIGTVAGVYPVMIPHGTGITVVTTAADLLIVEGR